MSIKNMMLNIREVHPKMVLMFKVGVFYEVYGKDAYILSYLFGYQVTKKDEYDTPRLGFSKAAISKVLAKLENEKIDYLLIDVKNNYDVDGKSENRNLNRYDIIFEKANEYIKKQRKIDEIGKKLMKQINLDSFDITIKKIEEIVDETRKI